MGKGKQKQKQKQHRHGRHQQQQEEDSLPSSAFDLSISSPPPIVHDTTLVEDSPSAYGWDGPNKHELYQRSVQSPKGDISYLQKFFLTYIGGRSPVHLREDFCGTALICAEWLKGGTQRLATGLDLDAEALTWGLQYNIEKLGADACSRVHLFHGDVLQPISEARVITTTSFLSEISVTSGHSLKTLGTKEFADVPSGHCKKQDDLEGRNVDIARDDGIQYDDPRVTDSFPGVDIVCAFNYSCCCLQKRSDLVLYFKHALEAINENGGIFAMDMYGGTSSECPLKLHRNFGDFTYLWEQEEFDVIARTTNISLHFRLKNNRMLRHAFTYHWRLWSLPELRDCLKEAGFGSIHFWIRKMPTLRGREEDEDMEDDDAKYEEVSCFHQQDAWNAYIIAVARKKFRD